MLIAGEKTHAVSPRCLSEMLASTLPWGGVLRDTRRKQSLKMPRLELVGLGFYPSVRHNGAAQGVASWRVLFQGNAFLRSKGNYGWFSFGT